MQIKEYQWHPVFFKGKTPLWGYEVDEEDPQLLQPIPEHLDALEQAKDFREQGRSLREIARWLSNYTGVSLSHTGLVKRIERDNEQFEKV
tara:strand:+ start:4424 stop:4693 length:270 start_codon:yes stop_codon:yes gene_type:complete